MTSRLLVSLVLLGVAASCTSLRRPARPDVSGFLDDYSLLREGAPGEVALVYRNPEAKWTSYDNILLEPVTLWRSGRKSIGEGEIRDAATNQLLAAGVDRRRRNGAQPIDTWAQVTRAMDFWADRVCTRLEARTGKKRAP